MPHLSQFTFLDKSGEKSTHTIYNGAITAISIADFLTEFGDYRTALAGITIGTIHQESWIGDRTILSQALPASNWAQRETKLLVTYQGDNTDKLFTLEIPTPDLDSLTLAEESDQVVLADDGVMAAWVTAFEQLARSPDSDQETVTVLRARIVGRNV